MGMGMGTLNIMGQSNYYNNSMPTQQHGEQYYEHQYLDQNRLGM